MKKNHQLKFTRLVLLLATFGCNSALQAQCVESLGSASNALSTFNNRANQIIVNNDLNTVVFIHRNDISLYGGDNGNFKYDISTDNGATWQLNQGNLNPGSTVGVNGGRYPQIGIYNPAANTDPANATLVYHGPTVGTNFEGYVSGSLLLDGAASSTENYNQAGVTNTLIPGGFCQSMPGTFWTIDAITPDDGFTISGIRILKGTYSSGDVTWTVQTELSPDFNTDIFGSPAVTDFNMAFDPSGQYGWVVVLTHLNGLTDYNYHPVFYNTSDGGTTWSGPEQLDLTSFAAITSVEANPGCGFESDIAVDINGNPHVLIGVFKSAGNYNINVSPAGHLFDFTYNGSSWNAINITRTGFQQFFTDQGVLLNRPQISSSNDGSKLVFTWVESDLPSSSGVNAPNLKAVTYDVPTGNVSCPVTYSLKCSSALDGQMYQTTVSPNMIDESGLFTVPVVLSILNASGTALDPVQYYYLNDLSFTDADFSTSNAVTYPSITVNGSNPICGGGSVELFADDHPSFLWNTGETTQSILAYGGNYWVIDPDENTCIGSSNSVFVESIYPPEIYPNGPTLLCNGATVDLFVQYYSATGSVLWSNGETTQVITVSSAGNYSVTVDGCTSTYSIEVTVSDNDYIPSLTVDGPTTVCYPASITLTANDNSNYLWNTGETTQSIIVFYTGNYWVVNPDSNFCVSGNNSVNLEVNYPPDIFAFGPTILCDGATVDLYAQYYSYGNSILWSTGETTQIITVSTTGSYSVTVDGCPSLYSVNVEAVSGPPANDNVCNARLLTVGTLTSFNNNCATVEAGEPVPPLAIPWDISQDGWGTDNATFTDVSLDHSVWFSFLAPQSGAVNILVDGFDSQLALYSSSNYTCSGAFTLIAANEDGSPSYLYGSLINRAYCLEKGKRYFVQVDGWGETMGTGTILVTAVPNTVNICHKIAGQNPVTLTVSGCALAAHLAHGDQIGDCPTVRFSASNEADVTSQTLVVYPNPATEIVHVAFTSDMEESYKMRLVDIAGRLIYSANYQATVGENEQELDLQNVTPGIYFLTLIKGGNVMQSKIVKE